MEALHVCLEEESPFIGLMFDPVIHDQVIEALVSFQSKIEVNCPFRIKIEMFIAPLLHRGTRVSTFISASSPSIMRRASKRKSRGELELS